MNAITLALGALALGGCDRKQEQKAVGVVVTPCQLNLQNPGSMRSVGKAKIKLEGKGISVDTEAPCTCGPMFNRDEPKLGIRAGDGVLFEACLPHGLVQINAVTRTEGTQSLHDGQESGVEVSFSRTADAVYTSRGKPTDKVTLTGVAKAVADVELHDVSTDRVMRANLSFECKGAKVP